MYFRFQQRAQLLTVRDNFAHLAEVNSVGDLNFEFTYTVSQREVVKRNALKVNVKIESRHIDKKPILGVSHRGYIDTKAVVNNFRTAVIDAKSASEQQQKYLVAFRSSDITAFINNEIVSQLRVNAPTKNISYFNKPRLRLVSAAEIKKNNDPQPILHRVANSHFVPDLQFAMTASAAEDPRALMHDMIIRQGLDPTYVFDLAPRSETERSSREGLLNPTSAVEKQTDPASRLLHFYLFPPIFDEPPRSTTGVSDSELVNVLEVVSTDELDITVPLQVPVSKLRLEGVQTNQVYVIFELVDSNSNLAIDSVTKVLDVSRHLNLYNTPKSAPRLNTSSSDVSTRLNLEIKQIDPGATSVDVYKKSLWISSSEIDDYTLIGSYPLTSKDQSLLVPVAKPQNSPVLYRVIPRGGDTVQGLEYANIVVKPARYAPMHAVSLTAKQVDSGIQLEVRQFPTNVVAVQILRRNLTTFETSSTTVSGDIGIIDAGVRQANLLSTIDSDVFANNVYQYVARLIYKNGHTVDFGSATIEFIKPSPGEVDTKISDLQVNHDLTPNVTFNINTTLIDTDIDIVKKMLDVQGLADFFTDDITKQRDQLKKLIAHQVHRIDLNTGQVENFGILTAPAFDDDALRKNQAISPLVYGHVYRYIVYPLLRGSETLFDGFVKEAVDPRTKNSYTFSPAKYLHPFTLSRGVLITSKGSLLRQAKDPMSHGIIGSIASIDVSFDKDTAVIIDASANNFDRYLNVVSWKVLGNINNVDHFLILKKVHGIRTLLGKVHSEFVNGSCQFIHKITPHDVGALQYVIIPIFNDYKVGASTVTNTLIVEAP